MPAPLTARFQAAVERYAAGWDEQKHPRDKGKFAEKSGAGAGPEQPAEPATPKEPQSNVSERHQAEKGDLMEKVGDYLSRAVEHDRISPAAAEHYRKAFEYVADRMMPEALRRLNCNLNKVVFYGNSMELTEDLDPGLLKQGKRLGGCWVHEENFGIGDLHLDGGNGDDESLGVGTSEYYAHEIGHAIDWHPLGSEKKGPISGSREWREAYAAEIDQEGGPLSNYARKHPCEGFAEFWRAACHQPGYTRKAFPKCWAVLVANDLMPNPKKQD